MNAVIPPPPPLNRFRRTGLGRAKAIVMRSLIAVILDENTRQIDRHNALALVVDQTGTMTVKPMAALVTALEDDLVEEARSNGLFDLAIPTLVDTYFAMFRLARDRRLAFNRTIRSFARARDAGGRARTAAKIAADQKEPEPEDEAGNPAIELTEEIMEEISIIQMGYSPAPTLDWMAN